MQCAVGLSCAAGQCTCPISILCCNLLCGLQEVDERMFSAYLEPQLGVEGEPRA